MRRKIENKLGFTLVELAIVLVIIGFIVSSVLVGQDLIKAAKLRATVREYQQFQAAVNTFIEKYGQVPGDIDNDKYGLTTTDTTGGCDAGTTGDGDEDGLIEGAAVSGTMSTDTTHDGETLCFWANLTVTGRELIPGSYTGLEDGGTDGTPAALVIGEQVPAMRINSTYGWGVFNDGTDNYFITGATADADATIAYATSDVFVPIDAYNIDNKIDDGVPTSGDVVSRAGDGANPDTAATTATTTSTTVCDNTANTPDEYQYTATSAVCTLRFKMQTF